MKKRILLLLLVAVLLLCMAACKSDPAPSDVGNTKPEDFGQAIQPSEMMGNVPVTTAKNDLNGKALTIYQPTSWYVGDSIRERFFTAKEPCELECTVYYGTEPIAIQWYRDGNPIEGANKETFAADQPGVYHMTATDAAGAVAESDPIPVREAGLNGVNVMEPDDFLMYVDDVFKISDKGVVLYGIVYHGKVNAGDVLRLMAWDEDTLEYREYTVTVRSIERSHEQMDHAESRDYVSLIVGDDVESSQVPIGSALVPATSALKAVTGKLTGMLYCNEQGRGGMVEPFTVGDRKDFAILQMHPETKNNDLVPRYYVSGCFVDLNGAEACAPKGVYENVIAGELEHPVFLFPGQELLFMEDGNWSALFTVTEID